MTQDVEREVLAAEHRRCQALLEADMEALGSLLSDGLHFMHANAVADDKPALLAKMAKGNIAYHALDVDEAGVTDLGDVAMLTSKLTAQVTVGGVDKEIVNRTLSVWRREDGAWRLLAYQPTPVPR